MHYLERFKSLYRVDNVPILIRPFWLGVSYILGIFQYLIQLIVHYSSHIEFIGNDPRKKDFRCIYAVWHGEIFVLFSAFARFKKLAVINHPLWYMKPIHVMLYLFGVEKIYLGSSGYNGRRAADSLIEALASKKFSSIVNPDGPSGPVRKLRGGILHMAHKSRLPIVALAISCKPEFRLNTWDRKLIALPFSHIRVRFSEPIYVTNENFAEAKKNLIQALNQT